MPAGFEWSDIDVNDPAQLLELYNLLTENYVEDDDCQFRCVRSFPLFHICSRFIWMQVRLFRGVFEVGFDATWVHASIACWSALIEDQEPNGLHYWYTI